MGGAETLAGCPVYAKLPASDIDRAARFYAERLGLKPVSEAPGHFFYRCGSATFLLFRSQGTAAGTHDQMGWFVSDIEKAVRKLKARGVSFETFDMPGNAWHGEIADNGFRRSAWFRDSEGNLLNLFQRSG